MDGRVNGGGKMRLTRVGEVGFVASSLVAAVFGGEVAHVDGSELL